jgi:hypothetical protein
LFAHDGGYARCLQRILDLGGKVRVIGFREWIAPALLQLRVAGAEVVDLEHEVGAFKVPLPRLFRPEDLAIME